MQTDTPRLPAEWEPHAATLLAWPHEPSIWRGQLQSVQDTLVQFTALLSHGERVVMCVADAYDPNRVSARLSRAGANMRNVDLFSVELDDIWLRDTAPLVTVQKSGAVAVNFDFNAWGSKYPYARDRALGARLADFLALPLAQSELVLEGGAIDWNGQGQALTSRGALLDPMRNHRPTVERMEAALGQHLGLRRLCWLDGKLDGDDTDGHVDTLARFVGTHRVVTLSAPVGHPLQAVLAANTQRLENWRDEAGHSLEVITVELPSEPLSFQGRALPASPVNFYIGNDCVVIPTFGGNDPGLVEILQACFPDRQVQQIDSRALLVGNGSLHCLCMQIPESVRALETPTD